MGEWIDCNDMTPHTYHIEYLNKKTGAKKIRYDNLDYYLVDVKFADGKVQRAWFDGNVWDFGLRHSLKKVVAWRKNSCDC